MTPLAKRVWKRLYRPQPGRQFADAGLLRIPFASTHFFDVSDVTALAAEIGTLVNERLRDIGGQCLPFPVTWMEFSTKEGTPCAFVLVETEDCFRAHLILVQGWFSRFIATIPLDRAPSAGDVLQLSDLALGAAELTNDTIFAFTLLHLINSDHTVVTHTARRETAPIARSILKRSRSEGAFPLRGWTEITLTAFHHREIEENGVGGVARRVCEHWVRKHPRHLRDGRVIWIPAHKRGDKALGIKQTRYRVVPPAEGRGCDQ
jgi:hypothetical protein